ncbi:beta-1,3-galactosyltransferase 2 isoform X2 [Xenopus laevis]|uniref:Hexosyltransferase n=1 Tax=Xenopus laevis TaxID=8355 RepID=A0A8J1MN07_XENLA|nr:beta-1,3-galactosyltransferase 2 isoform X2 [Xenopus laevis]XP_041443165.1 beta-1,3-galactosyltransferase 2 isoform X2 [Xenopus laevis]
MVNILYAGEWAFPCVHMTFTGSHDWVKTGMNENSFTQQGGNKTQRFSFFILCWLVLLVYVSYSYNTIGRNNIAVILATKEPIITKPLYPYLIEEPSKCRGDPPFLLLLIPSMPQDVLIRDVLRKTWANESLVPEISIKRIFLLGHSHNNDVEMAVRQESSTFHDIIQQDFLDTYRNLTIKTLMGIEWVSRLCPRVSYVMKVDSDMFFNPWFLVKQILQPEKPLKLGLFTGRVMSGASPNRNKKSKWYISYSDYSENGYATYCSGTGYVFSGGLAPLIYKQAMELSLLPFEDVFVGLCLKRIGLYISWPGRYWFNIDRIKYNGCQFARLVTVHHYKSEELLNLWPDFLKAIKTCT